MTQSLRQVHGQWCVQNFAQGNERYQIMIRVVSGQQSSDNIAFESQSGLATKAPSEPTPGRPRLNLSLKFSFTQVNIVPASRRYVQYVQRFGTVAVFIPLERFLTHFRQVRRRIGTRGPPSLEWYGPIPIIESFRFGGYQLGLELVLVCVPVQIMSSI